MMDKAPLNPNVPAFVPRPVTSAPFYVPQPHVAFAPNQFIANEVYFPHIPYVVHGAYAQPYFQDHRPLLPTPHFAKTSPIRQSHIIRRPHPRKVHNADQERPLETIGIVPSGAIASQQASLDLDFPAIGEAVNSNASNWGPSFMGHKSYKDAMLANTGLKAEPFSLYRVELTETPQAMVATDDAPNLNSKTSDKKSKKKKSKLTKSVLAEPKRSSRRLAPLTLDSFIPCRVVSNSLTDESRSRVKAQASKPAPRNILDASAPTKLKGKEREKPKKKKATRIRKVILKEKARRLIRLQASKSLIEKRKLVAEKSEQVLEEPIEVETSEEESSKSYEDVEVNNEEEQESDAHRLCKRILHCNAFRDYCSQSLGDEIDDYASRVLMDLTRFQSRLFEKDPVKAQSKRRLTCGLKEVAKYVELDKLRCLVIAPDIQLIENNGVLDTTVHKLISNAEAHSIPIVFALQRKQIAHLCHKKGKVSCVGILNADGTLENLKELLDRVKVAREEYADVFQQTLELVNVMRPDERSFLAKRLPSLVPQCFASLKRQLRKQTFYWRVNETTNNGRTNCNMLAHQMNQLAV